MSAPQYCNRANRNLGIASGPIFFFKSTRGSWKKKILIDSHPYSHETSIFTLGAPHVMRKCNDGFISISNSEQEEQTNREKYDFYCSVSQIHINPEKKHTKKPIIMIV